ncbi:MAG: hypothetical protein EHM64_16095 [Ignavibacteriae bacterium]|nr:MAG: hypothetical protein EHM64_16095 [Ignavibacteriota bacterium]
MTLLQIGKLVFVIVEAFECVVGIVGLRRWKQLTPPLRLFEVFIWFSLVVVIIESIMANFNIRNLWMQHWYSLFELLAYSILYYLWRPDKRFGLLLWMSFALYLAVWIIGKFSFEPFYYMDVYSGSVSQVIQMGFGGWLLYAASQEKMFDWKKDPRFLVVTGIAVYAASTFLLFTMFNVMLTLPRQTMRLIYLSNSVFIILQYSIFLWAFLCQPKSVAVTLHD